MNKATSGAVGALIGAAIVRLTFIVSGPLLMIWGLNTLFPVLTIPYTFFTWAASFILISFLEASCKKIASKNGR